MYDWLTGALEDSSQVVTANRRLAKVLAEHYAQLQLEAGRTAWRSPGILAWPDWLLQLRATAELSQPMPICLNGHQSRMLWERCLRREISNPLLSISGLVRQSRDTWQKLHDYCVPLEQVSAAAQGRDQQIFASAARGYQSLLDRDGWIDDAKLPGIVVELVRNGHAVAAGSVVFAGFDRLTPVAQLLYDELLEAGSECRLIEQSPPQGAGQLMGYENSDAELRAAGAWARQSLLDNSDQVIGIVASQLERDSERSARMLREGFVPGWQTAGEAHFAAVNVSYGKRLIAYPLIAVAMHLLQWLQEDIGSAELSLLLRSAACGDGGQGLRSRVDLELRRLPVMTWSPARFLRAFDRSEADAISTDWHDRVRMLANLRESVPSRCSPSEWAMYIDDFLTKFNWPGPASLSSVEFQLVNRWRELLNDLARLELVAATMSLQEAISRLRTMAAETVFQAKSEGAVVQLLGPLEAAGMEFDQLWISGLSAANWPPSARPSPLVSRQLQRKYAMPDAAPGDTLAYADKLLRRLAASSTHLACSYPLTDGDAEQSPSGLIDAWVEQNIEPVPDPGWYAARLAGSVAVVTSAEDPLLPVTGEEVVTGGAATLQMQLVDPFAAFAYGRLGVRPVPAFATGLPANTRGNLIHDALHELYRDLPSRADVARWIDASLEQRMPDILKHAFARLERHADGTLKSLLQLEKKRVGELLQKVVALDSSRGNFAVTALESSLELVMDQLRLRLRIDRIDRLDSGELVILDYKTGQGRQFVNATMQPDDLQLVVYACAVAEPVAGLAFFNVDSRQVSINGAGRELTPDLDWDEALADWSQQVVAAAAAMQRGDARVNTAVPVRNSRSFALLSRIRELLHEQH
jgi:probable DNA repair protein